MIRQIEDWHVGIPAGWGSWFPHEAAQTADQVAAALGVNPAAQARVRESVMTLDATVGTGMILSAAVWVPDASTGEPCGFLQVELLGVETTREASAEEYLHAVSSRRQRRGVKVFDHSTSLTDTDAGPAVIEVLVTAERRSRQVISGIVWTVFPPGSNQAVRLEFTTPIPAMFEALSTQSVVIARSTVLTLTSSA